MSSLNLDSYPPPTSCPTPTPFPKRPLLPVVPPTATILSSVPKPPLPSPPRTPAFSPSVLDKWSLSTHIIPACYLRTTPYNPELELNNNHATKKEKSAWFKNFTNNLLDKRVVESGKVGYKQPGSGVLWNCLNRYVRKDVDERRRKGRQSVTLFFVHATGFPKEIWEPVLNRILGSYTGSIVDEIWCWEAVQHGDASILNSGKLGRDFDWADNTRDILNFLLHYLAPEASAAPLPTHLNLVHAYETKYRMLRGFSQRKLICVGHSLGACCSMQAALNYSRLFSSLVVIDPAMVKPDEISVKLNAEYTYILAYGALTRRDSWKSVDDAMENLANSSVAGWDPEILKVYVECGTTPVSSTPSSRSEWAGGGGVRLKASPYQEAVVYADQHTRSEVYNQVPTLDKRVMLRWVMPGARDALEFGPPGSARDRVWLRPQNSANVRIPGSGHLIPQERPHLLADYLAAFIQENYDDQLPQREPRDLRAKM